MKAYDALAKSIIDVLSRILKWEQDKVASVKEKYPEPLMPPKPPDLPQNDPAIESKREKLYRIAVECLNPPRDMSPLDRADDSLACMESVDGVYYAAFGEHLLTFEDRLSTARGHASMSINPKLEMVREPQAGDIVISPTGMSTKNSKHGHVGIWGRFDVMSNDSNSGVWMDNYTHAAWYEVFNKTLGFPVFFFRKNEL